MPKCSKEHWAAGTRRQAWGWLPAYVWGLQKLLACYPCSGRSCEKALGQRLNAFVSLTPLRAPGGPSTATEPHPHPEVQVTGKGTGATPQPGPAEVLSCGSTRFPRRGEHVTESGRGRPLWDHRPLAEAAAGGILVLLEEMSSS